MHAESTKIPNVESEPYWGALQSIPLRVRSPILYWQFWTFLRHFLWFFDMYIAQPSGGVWQRTRYPGTPTDHELFISDIFSGLTLLQTTQISSGSACIHISTIRMSFTTDLISRNYYWLWTFRLQYFLNPYFPKSI